MIDILTLIVLATTLGFIIKYTHDTAKLAKFEGQRRIVEHEVLLAKYDLNLELLSYSDNKETKTVRLTLDNRGGPVSDVQIIAGENSKLIKYTRTELWYPSTGKMWFKHDPKPPEEILPLAHFRFAAIYTNKFGQRRTKSFVVRINRRIKNEYWIREIDTLDGEWPNHLEMIGNHLPISNENKLLEG